MPKNVVFRLFKLGQMSGPATSNVQRESIGRPSQPRKSAIKTFSTFCQITKVLDMCRAYSKEDEEEELAPPFKTNIYKIPPKKGKITTTAFASRKTSAASWVVAS